MNVAGSGLGFTGMVYEFRHTAQIIQDSLNGCAGFFDCAKGYLALADAAFLGVTAAGLLLLGTASAFGYFAWNLGRGAWIDLRRNRSDTNAIT
jgi:hypothetical protein